MRQLLRNHQPAAPKVRMEAVVTPELHWQVKEQAFRNNEPMGDLLTRLINSAPAVAWNKPQE